MIPTSVLDYLIRHDVPYEVVAHPSAVGAQELAHVLRVSGNRVCKAVLVEADGIPWIAALPASAQIDFDLLARALDGRKVELMSEPTFARLFPGCEVGAEPPFGGLYGLPVIVDPSIGREARIIVRAGSHTECLELRTDDFLELERPRIAWFANTAPAWHADRII